MTESTRQSLPHNWHKVPKIGQPIVNTPFILSKTPIDVDTTIYDTTTLVKDTYYQYTIAQLVDYFTLNKTKLKPLGLVVNITDTQPVYSTQLLSQYNITYVTIPIKYDSTLYDKQIYTITRLFNNIVNKFIDTNTDKDFNARGIVVHDIYGYNISAYCIAAYLIDECNYTVTRALSDIGNSRQPGIYNRDALISLQMRYGTQGDKISIPKPPAWDKPTTTTQNKTTTSNTNGSTNVTATSTVTTAPTAESTNTTTDTQPSKQKRGLVKSAPTTTQPDTSTDNNKRQKIDTLTRTSNITQQHTYLKPCDTTTTQHITQTLNKLVPNIFTHLQYVDLTTELLHNIAQHKSDYTISWLPQCYHCILAVIDNTAYLCLNDTEIYTIDDYTVYDIQNNTVAVGELVIDTDKKTQTQSCRLLITDLLYTSSNPTILHQPLDTRLATAQTALIDVSAKHTTVQQSTLRLRIKKMYPCNNIGKAIAIIPSLPHTGVGITICTKFITMDAVQKYKWLLNDNTVSPSDLLLQFTAQ